ncbi:hypothetical protein VP01_953g12 [Puccinia sorghi]|uniref:Tyrosinase copper-binding domain-containing protein n=1 Tax=Puccinia sorghi TaxID=27349 RepID=A0A0L6U6A8_9BASI|nr:hypothetical protein VP01_953g12 [Puccinia sorghi]
MNVGGKCLEIENPITGSTTISALSWGRNYQPDPPPLPPAQPAPQAPTPPAPSPPAPSPPAPSPPAPPATVVASRAPSSQSNGTTAGCQIIRVRREWRKFSVKEQTEYIRAVKCLAGLPSKVLPADEYRRYDDFENVHSRMRHKIHWIASFLPWHRHYMFTYETALRDECGYSGNLPRWDWSLDSDDMSKSPIWSPDPNVGFGTNVQDSSKSGDGLDGAPVQDGAFANWPLYYPEYHTLQRNYNLPAQYQQPGRSYGSQFLPAAL